MSTHRDPEQTDPRLKRMLEAYGHVPERDPQKAQRTQEKFLAELNSLFQEPGQAAIQIHPPSPSTWAANFYRILEKITMSFKNRSPLPRMLTAILVVFILLGSASAAAAAANSSLPGDALYSLKLSLESVRTKLTGDPALQARLHLDFAGTRLGEIESLIEQGRFADIPEATAAFERHIQQALESVQALAEADPAQAADLAQEINTALFSYSEALSRMLDDVPAEVQPELETAIQASGSMGGSPSLSGNANEAVNTNGSDDSNGNINDDNTNSIEDGNLNSNTNSSDDISGNTNANDNSNMNTNGNTNAGDDINANTNGNSNGDDNSNANTNSNINADDNSNANTNGDDDSNQNDNDDNTNGNG